MLVPLFEDSIEALAETTNKAVDELISATPALQELFHRSDSTEKEECLRELVTQVVDQRRSLIRGSLNEYRNFLGFVSEKEAVEVAKKYLAMPWAHTSWLTNYVAANLIAAVIGEERHRLAWGKKIMRLLLPTLWNRFTSAVVSVAFFLSLLVLSSFLFTQHLAVFGWLVVGFMLWNYVGGLVLKLKTDSFFGTLTFIANEINSGCYDREEMIRRLRKIDDDRLIRFAVPSLVYSLLRLSEPQRAPTGNVDLQARRTR